MAGKFLTDFSDLTSVRREIASVAPDREVFGKGYFQRFGWDESPITEDEVPPGAAKPRKRLPRVPARSSR